MHNIDEYIKYLEESSIIDFSICFEMAEMCSAKIDSDPAFSRRLCINVLNNWAKIPEGCRIIWNSIIESLGFYPYIQKEQIKLDSLSEECVMACLNHIFYQANSTMMNNEELSVKSLKVRI